MKTLARLLTLLVALGLTGCSLASRTVAKWEAIAIDNPSPWTAPNQRAVLQSRDYHVSMLADAQGHDERWRAPDGRTVDAWKTSERLVDLLKATGELQRWPEAGGHVYKVGAVRLGPYRIYVVSVFPDVAVLIPHDYGPLANRSNYDLVGGGEGELSLGDSRILNRIYYRTSLPAAPRVFWISADLAVPPTPAPATADGGFAITHPKIELVGQPSGGGLSVARLR